MKIDLVLMGLGFAGAIALVAASNKTFVAGVRTSISPDIFNVGPAYLIANQPPVNGQVMSGILPPVGNQQLGASQSSPIPQFTSYGGGCATCGGM